MNSSTKVGSSIIGFKQNVGLHTIVPLMLKNEF